MQSALTSGKLPHKSSIAPMIVQNAKCTYQTKALLLHLSNLTAAPTLLSRRIRLRGKLFGTKLVEFQFLGKFQLGDVDGQEEVAQ